MTITEDIRQQVIKEYEAQKYRQACEKKVKAKPIGRAQQYFRLLINRYGGLTNGGWKHEVNERVKRKICEKYNLAMITELGAEYYDEANEYAIELFTKETEKSEYKKNEIIVFDLPWVRNRFTGKLCHTQYSYTWDEWKTLCYNKVH